MGIAQSVVAALREQGHDARHLLDEGLDRLADPLILAKARAENRIVLTHDLDFGDLLAAGGHATPSIVTFRLDDMRGANVLAHLLSALGTFESEMNRGAAVTITEGRARCRTLPMG